MLRKAASSFTVAALMSLFPAVVLAVPPVALFGTPVKGARRAVLQQTLAKAGLTPVRVNDNYFCDKYNTNAVPRGASKLLVCYTARSNIFAFAEYTFPSFMSAGQVKRVIDMVQYKYGPPSGVSGDYALGPVTAVWNLAGGMRIRVARGWPETTTFLDLTALSANGRLTRQLKLATQAEQKKLASGNAKAF